MRVFRAAVLGGLIAFAVLAGQSRRSLASKTASGRASARPNVILISVDTLRADHVGCYSATAGGTPNIDKLSQGGTVFEQVSSMVPLTLPSHVSMLTSTYPFVSGVRDNGDHLASGATTLASVLRSHGYRTAAFLGGFVLDRRFGLDRGFETYDSPSQARHSGVSDPGDIKRKGQEVATAAEAWLNSNSIHPFFLLLHIYDLHTPYNLTPAEATRYGDGYRGELTYIDNVIGGVLDYLRSHGLVDNSLIVFTSDHGEGLGDHGESTHGFFIYQSTLHVPLIFHWPANASLLPARVEAPASLLDVAPTILDAVRLPIPGALQGRSLLKEGGPREIYSESVYPEKHFASSPLASLRRGRYKYIDAPRPEFFDLTVDPGEKDNLYATKESVAAAYRERLQQLRRSYQSQSRETSGPLSPEAVERLHALGYLTGGNATTKPKAGSPDSGPDPKDRIADYEEYGRAIQLASQGRLEESNAVLKRILQTQGDLSDVRLALGLNEQRLGKDAEALRDFRTVLTADPANAIAHLDAGLSDYNMGKFGEAGEESSAALAISPGYIKAEVLLAKSLGQRGELAEAAAEFQRILQANPESYDAHDGLGTLAAMRGDWRESVQQLLAALAIEPAAAETHNTLGGVYLRTGDFASARTQFQEAVRIKPDYAQAHYNLGFVLLRLSDRAAARDEFQKALSADPNYSAAREALAELDRTR